MDKLASGDCSWGTMKQGFGWIIDTVDMTICLPQHHIDQLQDILDAFPPSQRCTSAKWWHKMLGELQSMSLALPEVCKVFSTMQTTLSTQSKNRIALTKGVHDALDDFRWMHNNITKRPTLIVEIIPLPLIAEGHHNASGVGASGIWFLGPN
ncbi:hypothetical protein ACHAXA_006455, partial [Cyclostephanos tholiformis]